MSDISKKIFSIEPDPDEEVMPPIADPLAIPDPETNDEEPDTHPILELVEKIDPESEEIDLESPDSIAPESHETKPQEIEETVDTHDFDDIPQIKLRPIIHSIVEPRPSKVDTSEFVLDEFTADTPPANAATQRKPLFSPQSEDYIQPVTNIAATFAPVAEAPVDRPLQPRLDRPVERASSPSVDTPPSLERRQSKAWVAPLLALGTMGAIAALIYVYLTEAPTLSPIGIAALILAVVLPALAVLALLSTTRAANAMRGEANKLASVADRLTRVDISVGNDVATLADTIRRELSAVDERLAITRRDVETLGVSVTDQAKSLGTLSQEMVQRSKLIAGTVGEQNETFGTLSTEFDTRMSQLTETLDRQGKTLADTSDMASQRVVSAAEALDHATRLTREHGESLDSTATSATEAITKAEARLSSLLERVAKQRDDLDGFFEARVAALSDLSQRLSDEKPLAEKALFSQSASLSAVDAQIEMTESRLSDLLKRVGEVQTTLTDRLGDIDTTLTDADKRSRDFTADIADRVSDSVAQTRREMSLMESELRALQARMDDAAQEVAKVETAVPKTEMPITQLAAKPTAIDPINMDELAIPDAGDDPLDLTEVLDVPSDIGKRPIDDRPPSSRPFGRRAYDRDDKNWQWRDMLGSLDVAPSDIDPSRTKSHAAPAIERPGPGVPLRAPEPPRPIDPAPQGSDVVARLCEVELAPSAILNETIITHAEQARREGGESRQNETVFASLNAPVIHLRGVLSADLEFRLRAESFRRHYDSWLSTVTDPNHAKAELSSAVGRAYLLCAAALSAT